MREDNWELHSFELLIEIYNKRFYNRARENISSSEKKLTHL